MENKKTNKVTIILCLISLLMGWVLGNIFNPEKGTSKVLEKKLLDSIEKKYQTEQKYYKLKMETLDFTGEAEKNKKIAEGFLSTYETVSYLELDLFKDTHKKVCVVGTVSSVKYEEDFNRTFVVVASTGGKPIICAIDGEKSDLIINKPVTVYGVYSNKVKELDTHLIKTDLFFQ